MMSLLCYPYNTEMSPVTAKRSDLAPPPPPPPTPLNTKQLLRPKVELQPYAPSPPSSNSNYLTMNPNQAQPKSQLNPYAKPFAPFTKSPFNALCLHAPMVVTRPFLFQPVIYFYNPTLLVSSSYPYEGQGNNSGITEGYGVFLNGKKQKQKQKKVEGHVGRQISEPKKADSNSEPKKADGNNKKSDGIDYQVMFAGGNTTLMIKNIPNRLQRHDLLQILDGHCCEENIKAEMHSDPCWSAYDFLYLPMDFGYGANLGYAFVNFTSTVAAIRFAKAFEKRGWDAQVPGNKKICEISRAAIQGRDALRSHFEHFKFHCNTDGYLPVLLSPPRDGRNRTNPTIVGKRIDHLAYKRKFPLPLVMRRAASIK